MDIGTIAAGAISGAGAAYKGWMTHGHDEPFDGPKFLRTILIGLGVGAIASFLGISPFQAELEIHLRLLELGLLGLASGYLDQFCIWLWARVKGLKPWKGGPTVEALASDALGAPPAPPS